MVVTGCYAQLKPDAVAKIEGVDVVLGAEQKKDPVSYTHLDVYKRQNRG